MIEIVTYPRLRAILCADWSKDIKKRDVYIADIGQREVRRLVGKWTAASVIEAAREAAGAGAALATFDAPIGVPTSYWQKLQQSEAFPKDAANFAQWLPEVARRARLLDSARTPWDWSVEHPFFAIAPVAGGRRVWEAALARAGVMPLRQVDERTGAKSPFITAGIPGVAGAAARALWKDLSLIMRAATALAAPASASAGESGVAPYGHPEGEQQKESTARHPEGEQQKERPKDLPTPTRPFALWPFDGPLDTLLAAEQVVVAEIYPRAAYALALSHARAADRPPLAIAKTNREVRQSALEALKSHPWLKKHGVALTDVKAAANSEDAFDALLAAAGLLRCVLERTPLAAADLIDPVAEGGIVGTGSLDLARREITYVIPKGTPPPTRPSRRKVLPPDMRPRIAGAPRTPQPPSGGPEYPCPIPGCDHVFVGSRGGWDAHVSSLRIHPKWKPDVRDPAERKALFKDRFTRFFVDRGSA